MDPLMLSDDFDEVRFFLAAEGENNRNSVKNNLFMKKINLYSED